MMAPGLEEGVGQGQVAGVRRQRVLQEKAFVKVLTVLAMEEHSVAVAEVGRELAVRLVVVEV